MKNIFLIIFISNIFIAFSQIDSSDIKVNTSTIHENTEIDIAVNKGNKSKIILGWNSYRPGLSSFNQGWALSDNGGRTFFGNDNSFPNSNNLNVNGGPVNVNGDPVVGFNASQNPFMFTMLSNGSIGFTIFNGTNWSNITTIPSLNSSNTIDKIAGIAVDDNYSSIAKNNIYLVGTDFDKKFNSNLIFSRLTASNNSFSSPQVLVDDSRLSHGADIKIGNNNKVFICWTDYGTKKGGHGEFIGFARSINNGNSFDLIKFDAFNICGIRIYNSGLGAYCNTRVNDFPSMAIDRSCLQYRDRIYICWADQKDCNASPLNKGSVIKMRYSDNDGTTWSDPINISKPEHSHAWFPRIGVDDRTGLITVAYFTFNGKNDCDKSSTYLSYSSNGGINWGHIQISDVNFEPMPIGGVTNDGYAGDYIGLAIHDNLCYVAWHDKRDSKYGVFLSKVEFNLPKRLIYARDYLIENDMNINSYVEIFAKGKITMKPGIKIETNPNAYLHIKSETAIELTPDFFALNPNTIIEIGSFNGCFDIGSSQLSIPSNGNIVFNIDSLNNTIEDNQNKYLFFPNPSNEYFIIQSHINHLEFDFKLIDFMGRSLIEGNSGKEGKAYVDITYLPSGTYSILINQSYYGKIIVSH
jgi:hypothetical protein